MAPRAMSRPWWNSAAGTSGKARIRWIAVIVAVMVAAWGGWRLVRGEAGGDEPTESYFDMARGPLRISISVSGQIKARELLVISNELEGQTTLLFIQPEGTRVSKGDLLAELDSSALVDKRVDQQILVQNSDAAFVSARENLEVVRNQAQSDVEKAELDLRFARQDLEKYREGELPREMKAAEATITLAREELSRAEERYTWSQRLYAEKYLSQSELQADELAANKARLDLELAETDLELLRDYTSKKTMAELESAARQTEMALERTIRKANADVVQAEANLKAKQSEFEREQGKLEKLERQIAKARIVAPMDGLVVYATSSQGGWRGNEEPLKEGQVVRERQALIHLPTTSSFVAEVPVHESSLDKLSVGMAAQVTIDALPGQTYRGKVQSIAPLPNAQRMFLNPDLKVYDTVISIAGENPAIRNGMSCQVEVILAEYSDALYVPIQAVIRVKGVPTVYVSEGDGWTPRAVKLGLDNNRVVVVEEGLEEGERVLLTPPLAHGELALGEASEGPMERRAEAGAGEAPPGAVEGGQASGEGGSTDGPRAFAPGGRPAETSGDGVNGGGSRVRPDRANGGGRRGPRPSAAGGESSGGGDVR